MFYGMWSRRIDEKGRISLKPFKEILENMVVIYIFDDHIKLFHKSFLSKKIFIHEFKRIWIAKVDVYGRIQLPKEVKKFFRDRITLIGRGDYFEIRKGE